MLHCHIKLDALSIAFRASSVCLKEYLKTKINLIPFVGQIKGQKEITAKLVSLRGFGRSVSVCLELLWLFFVCFFTAWAHCYTMELTGNYFDYGRETYLEKEKSSSKKLQRTVDMISRGGDQQAGSGI